MPFPLATAVLYSCCASPARDLSAPRHQFYFSNTSNSTTSAEVRDITVDGLDATLSAKSSAPSQGLVAGCLFCSRDTPCRGISLRDVRVRSARAGPQPRFACHHAHGTVDNASQASCLQPQHQDANASLIVWKRCTGYPRARELKTDARRIQLCGQPPARG